VPPIQNLNGSPAAQRRRLALIEELPAREAYAAWVEQLISMGITMFQLVAACNPSSYTQSSRTLPIISDEMSIPSRSSSVGATS
jgi:hypothetical protein